MGDRRLFWIETCQACDGNRGKYVTAYNCPGSGYRQEWVYCDKCNGTGQICTPAGREDDGEEITEEWLALVGTRDEECDYPRFEFFAVKGDRNSQRELYVSNHFADEWEACFDQGHPWPKYLKTRGDLRCLCAALGVELREGE